MQDSIMIAFIIRRIEKTVQKLNDNLDFKIVHKNNVHEIPAKAKNYRT